MQAVILQNLREKAELSTWPSKRIKKSPAASRLVEPLNATDAKKVPLLARPGLAGILYPSLVVLKHAYMCQGGC